MILFRPVGAIVEVLSLVRTKSILDLTWTHLKATPNRYESMHNVYKPMSVRLAGAWQLTSNCLQYWLALIMRSIDRVTAARQVDGLRCSGFDSGMQLLGKTYGDGSSIHSDTMRWCYICPNMMARWMDTISSKISVSLRASSSPSYDRHVTLKI